MSTFSIRTVQKIPIDLDAAWSFFSNPANLQDITPSTLGFEVLSKNLGTKIYEGQIIEYKIRPLWGIPIYWMTEITHIQERRSFIDEQRFGPYQFWHHQHFFKSIDGGVEMIDLVHYRLPAGFLGNIANHIFVNKQLLYIFDFRQNQIEKLFGKLTAEKIEFTPVFH